MVSRIITVFRTRRLEIGIANSPNDKQIDSQATSKILISINIPRVPGRRNQIQNHSGLIVDNFRCIVPIQWLG